MSGIFCTFAKQNEDIGMAKKSEKKEDESKKVVAKCDYPNEVVANCDHPDEVIANCENPQLAVAICDHKEPIEDKDTPIRIHTETILRLLR